MPRMLGAVALNTELSGSPAVFLSMPDKISGSLFWWGFSATSGSSLPFTDPRPSGSVTSRPGKPLLYGANQLGGLRGAGGL